MAKAKKGKTGGGKGKHPLETIWVSPVTIPKTSNEPRRHAPWSRGDDD